MTEVWPLCCLLSDLYVSARQVKQLVDATQLSNWLCLSGLRPTLGSRLMFVGLLDSVKSDHRYTVVTDRHACDIYEFYCIYNGRLVWMTAAV